MFILWQTSCRNITIFSVFFFSVQLKRCFPSHLWRLSLWLKGECFLREISLPYILVHGPFMSHIRFINIFCPLSHFCRASFGVICCLRKKNLFNQPRLGRCLRLKNSFPPFPISLICPLFFPNCLFLTQTQSRPAQLQLQQRRRSGHPAGVHSGWNAERRADRLLYVHVPVLQQ